MGNPYEGYDAIDPWDDTDELEDVEATGNFEYVEDAYAPLVEDGADALESTAEHPLMETAQPNHTLPQDKDDQAAAGLPKTMVRPFYGEAVQGQAQAQPYAQSQAEAPAGATLVRHRKQSRQQQDQARRQAPDTAAPYAAAEAAAAHAPSRREQAQARRAQKRAQKRALKAQRKQRRPRRRHGSLVTMLIFVAVIVAGYLVVCGPIDRQLAFSQEEAQTVRGKTSWAIPGMPYYVLALGSDAREGDTYSRTDSMMLVRVDLIGGKLTMISIPRDTKVDIPGYGTQKINAAYAFAGAGGAVQAVSELTGVPVNHVAVIHFDELAGLVDYLGGVTVNVPVATYDPEHTGLSLDAGIQTLDGATALAWARTRYGFENGDFQRQEDQRILMTSIMNRILSLSPRQLPGAIGKLGELIGTDLRCYDLVPLFLRMRLGKPVIYSCSVPSTTAMIDGVSYVIADEEGLANMMRIVNAGGDPSAVGY